MKKNQIYKLTGVLFAFLLFGFLLRNQFNAESVHRRSYIFLYLLSAVSVCLSAAELPKFVGKRSICFLSILMPAIGFCIFETFQGNVFSIVSAASVPVLVFNYLLYAVLYLVFFVLFGKIGIAMAAGTVFIALFAIVNYFTVMFRGKGIMPQDILNFSTALSVAGKYQWKITARFIAGFALTLAAVTFWAGIQKTEKKPSLRILGLIALTVSLAVIRYPFYGQNIAQIKVSAFNIQDTYEACGLLPAMVMACKSIQVSPPDCYSAERVHNISEQTESSDTNAPDLPDNVIIIMNEAWSDLRVFNNFSTDKQVSPFIDSLNTNTAKGFCYTSVFGSETVNSEFEFLTGNSMAAMPVGSTPYQYYINEEAFPSLPQYFKELGYETVAFHPFDAKNYNRIQVYNRMGFEEYLSADDFNDEELRYFATDLSDFNDLISIYENKKTDKLFIFNVTIQNHGGYIYDNNEFPSTVHIRGHEGEFPEAEQYLTLTALTDKAFLRLIDYFSKKDEKTVILMFGDHQPSLEAGFYQTFQNAGNVYDERYISSYVLWSSYDLNMKEMRDVSLNYLSSLLLKTAGFELPAYSKYLLNLAEEYPIINRQGYGEQMEAFTLWDPEKNIPERIEEYNMLQYNFMFDRKERLTDFYWQKPA